MADNERLQEIIKSDLKEDAVSCKQLNVKKLLASNFIDRFLSFSNDYDKEFNTDVFDTNILNSS